MAVIIRHQSTQNETYFAHTEMFVSQKTTCDQWSIPIKFQVNCSHDNREYTGYPSHTIVHACRNCRAFLKVDWLSRLLSVICTGSKPSWRRQRKLHKRQNSSKKKFSLRTCIKHYSINYSYELCEISSGLEEKASAESTRPYHVQILPIFWAAIQLERPLWKLAIPQQPCNPRPCILIPSWNGIGGLIYGIYQMPHLQITP